MTEHNYKKCSKCKKILPLEMYHVDSNSKSGCQNYCIECRKKSNLEYRKWKVQCENCKEHKLYTKFDSHTYDGKFNRCKHCQVRLEGLVYL
jgi:hypothetical protein